MMLQRRFASKTDRSMFASLYRFKLGPPPTADDGRRSLFLYRRLLLEGTASLDSSIDRNRFTSELKWLFE